MPLLCKQLELNLWEYTDCNSKPCNVILNFSPLYRTVLHHFLLGNVLKYDLRETTLGFNIYQIVQKHDFQFLTLVLRFSWFVRETNGDQTSTWTQPVLSNEGNVSCSKKNNNQTSSWTQPVLSNEGKVSCSKKNNNQTSSWTQPVLNNEGNVSC